ncbi:hypothetical protein [Burkholderia multivorans]|uniref:hypothetical protein n=1 Tax=Burkholderia multivorans TaxID=87883 RepID=UPI002011C85F|nr:hypothetical protein [Burkholderia multivorans]
MSIGCDGSDRVEHVRNTYLGGRWWQFDDEINELGSSSGNACRLLKTDFKLSAPPRLRQTLYGQLNIRDRVLMCGRVGGDPLVLGITRSEQLGPFETRQVDALGERAATLLSIVARHYDLTMRARRLPGLLTDLAEIERQVALSGERLTARETEVCALSVRLADGRNRRRSRHRYGDRRHVPEASVRATVDRQPPRIAALVSERLRSFAVKARAFRPHGSRTASIVRNEFAARIDLLSGPNDADSDRVRPRATPLPASPPRRDGRPTPEHIERRNGQDRAV